MAEIGMGTLYDWNKSAMEQMKGLNATELKDKLREIKNKLFNQGKYYMLLCHERRDYTVFNLLRNTIIEHDVSKKASNELKECLENRGTILSIDDQHNGSWEIWIRNNEGVFCYYLFPYDNAIIEC